MADREAAKVDNQMIALGPKHWRDRPQQCVVCGRTGDLGQYLILGKLEAAHVECAERCGHVPVDGLDESPEETEPQ